MIFIGPCYEFSISKELVGQVHTPASAAGMLNSNLLSVADQ
jgi:S-adenosylmethionine:tRNA-ribosyltransferase-isomerase (queuine synthetase)